VTIGGRGNDSPWRRPPEGGGWPARPDLGTSAPQPGPDQPYWGPPPMLPPPASWHPPIVVEPAPPRPLPEQDHDLIDVQEQSARTLTIGVAMLAGAIMLVLVFLLCGRALF
jgi:hypothetical protein